jgi:signal transduction histidine kinase
MTLTRRLFLYFFSIFFVMLATICFFQYQREKEFRTEQLDNQLSIYNFTIHRFLQERNPSWEQLEDYVKLFPDSTLRVTVIDSAGYVTFDSFIEKGIKLTNHLNRPEIQMANYQPNGKAIRHSISTGNNYYYLAHKFNNIYVRSALPYNVSLISTLKANTFFFYFMLFVLIIGTIALYFISRNFSRSVDRLRIFTRKAEQGELPEAVIDFPNDELGEISEHIVQLYKLLLKTKDEVNREREKLIKHLQISQEGLGIFSADKKEILVNTHFVQYTNMLADKQSESSDDIFQLPELSEINQFIDQNLLFKRQNRKKITVEKGARIFSIQCIVFQDDTFEISINDISTQEHENQLKRQLTQNISHELKTPVSSILGYMESILENPELDPARQRFFIERSFQQAQRLRDLLQDISTLNKIDEGNRIFDKEEFNISNIIIDVINDVHLEIEQRHCNVLTNFGDNLKITGNKSLIYSIFRNLLDNALAYAGDNLTIDIKCFREDASFYYFSFSDNGIGVAEEHLNRLFERFYRVDKGRSRKLGGTGLGLAIVKNAVIYHKGNISAKCSPSGGLSFVFSLRKY